MRTVGLVLVLLSLGLAGGVSTRAIGGAASGTAAPAAERCEVPPDLPRVQVRPTRMPIALTPPDSGVEVIPLNTTGYNYADPSAPEPATPPASPAR